MDEEMDSDTLVVPVKVALLVSVRLAVGVSPLTEPDMVVVSVSVSVAGGVIPAVAVIDGVSVVVPKVVDKVPVKEPEVDTVKLIVPVGVGSGVSDGECV
jgi:hypothetical protein